MFNLFGARTMELNKQDPSEDYDEAEVESYLTELITDFSRARSEMQGGADEPDSGSGGEERTEYPFSRLRRETSEDDGGRDEIRRLQEDLERARSEIERERSRSEEELKSILSEKEKIEEKNRVLRSENEDALNRIRALAQEKEDAVQGENDAIEKYLEQLKENSDLADELFNLRFSGGERQDPDTVETGPDGTVRDEDSPGTDFESRYGGELATESGRELFMMLRGLLQDDARDDNGVRMTKTWEEEVEETIPGALPDEPAITRKVRTRSEVSVEYVAGHKNGM